MIQLTTQLLFVLALNVAEAPPRSPVELASFDAQGQPLRNQDWSLYRDGLSPPFNDLSHGDYSMMQKRMAREGRAMRFNPGRRGSLIFQSEAPVDVAAYSAIELWFNTSTQRSSADLVLQFTQGDGSTSKAVPVAAYAQEANLRAGEWTRVRVPFVELDLSSHLLTAIAIRGGGGSADAEEGDVYVDDIKLLTSRANGWMYTQGNRIKWSSGYNFHGSGANIQDGRSCGACLGADAWTSATEVNRRMDALVDVWGATFVRLTLESDSSESILNDPTYLQTIQGIVKYTTARGLPVLLSMWIDPSFNSQGWPTATTIQAWQKLAATFAYTPNLIFGLVNEPQQNYDGAQDWDVWNAMNNTVKAIRAVEAKYTNNQHIIAVQGTGGWARRLDFYVKYPISGAGGTNIAYETHAYDVQSQFYTRFGGPSQTLPVIIGEYGPVDGTMTTDDCIALQKQAKQYEVPYLAWTFHENCPPNLLAKNASGCGIGMNLAPTAWGNIVKNDLATGW